MSRKIFATKIEQDKVKLLHSCSTCRKPIAEGRKGSLTAWIFRADNCSCTQPLVSSGSTTDKPNIVSNAESLKTAGNYPDLDERFEILEFLGEGGMVRVYKVNDKDLGKTLVIKVLRAELGNDPQAVKRFEQEAKATEALTHPNLVPIYGSGLARDGSPFLVMEYLEGDNLAVILKQEGKIQEKRGLDILVQCAEALVHAHKKGVIHRDLKPSNIIITKTDSGADLVHLVDFGIAKIQGGNVRETHDLTQTGEVLGSPEYMSPEQCIGVGLKPQSDIYSFGCVMYECLSGKPPFSGENPIQIIAKHLNEAPKRLNKSEVSKGLEAIIFTCLQKDDKKRFKDSEELLDELRRVQSGNKPLVFAPDTSMPTFTRRQTIMMCIITAGYALLGPILLRANNVHLDDFYKIVFPLLFVAMWIVVGPLQWKKLYAKFEKERSLDRLLSLISFSLFIMSSMVLALLLSFVESKFSVDAFGLLILLGLASILGLFLSLFTFISSQIERRLKSAPIQRTLIYLSSIILISTGLAYSLPYASYGANVVADALFPFNRALSDSVFDQIEHCNPTASDPYFRKAVRYSELYHRTFNKKFADIAIVNLDEGISILSASRNKEPQKINQLRSIRICLYEMLKQHERALADVNEVIKNDPQGSYAKLSTFENSHFEQRGRLLMEMEKYKEALEDFSRAIAFEPENDRLYGERAGCYLALHNYSSALSDIDNALSFDQSNVDFRSLKTNILISMRDYEKALAELNMMIDLTPKDQANLLKRAFLYRKLGKEFEAGKDFKKVLDLGYAFDISSDKNGEKAARYFYKAQALKATGKTKAAARALKEAKDNILLEFRKNRNLESDDVDETQLLSFWLRVCEQNLESPLRNL